MTDILDMLHPAVKERTLQAKFAPKMNFDQRCAALALLQAGVARKVVAELFGCSHKTLSHMGNTRGIRYRRERDELANLGEVEFRNKYITPDLALKVNAIISGKVKAITDSNFEPASHAVNTPGGPNPKAKAREGWHTTPKGDRFEVVWLEADVCTPGSAAGWYGSDDQGPFYTNFDEKPAKTSTEAYNGCLEIIYGEKEQPPVRAGEYTTLILDWGDLNHDLALLAWTMNKYNLDRMEFVAKQLIDVKNQKGHDADLDGLLRLISLAQTVKDDLDAHIKQMFDNPKGKARAKRD
jgi:hypothetical protein